MINPNDPPYYAADTLVSMPVAPKYKPIIPMYGFAMTAFGIVHDITPEEADELAVPRYSPRRMDLPEVRGDAKLDAPRGYSIWQDRG